VQVLRKLEVSFAACLIGIVILATTTVYFHDLGVLLENQNKSFKKQINTLQSSRESLQEENNNLTSQYADLSLLCSQLSANYTSLNVTYSTLLLDYSNLKNLQVDVLQDYDVLQRNYTNLETTFQRLQTNYTNLQESYTYFQTQFNQLQADYDSRSQDYETLEQQYNTLESLYASLENEYNSYVSAYQSLRDEVNQRLWFLAEVESFITPQDSSVSAIVFDITGGWSDPSDFTEYWDDLKDMYLWVTNNIDYRYDGLSPMLPYSPWDSVYYYEDMWQFPNETLSLEKGDCDDQAILLCSMIRCYCDMQYWVECIWIHSSTSAHLGVQCPVQGDKLVIFDPAGNYYSHNFWGDIVFNDITTEINNWLDYWKPSMGNDVHVYRVFSDYIDKTFASTSEYITWMYSR